jgi:hypothetical protein
MKQPTDQQKIDLYADALIIALHDVASRIGEPDINAALAALTYAQAYLVAKLPAEHHRTAFGECGAALRRQTAAFAEEAQANG